MDFTEILNMFNISLEQVGKVSALVFTVVFWLRSQFPDWVYGYRSVVAALAVGFGLSFKMVYPDWGAVIALTIASFIVPAAGHKMLKMFFEKKAGSSEVKPNA